MRLLEQAKDGHFQRVTDSQSRPVECLTRADEQDLITEVCMGEATVTERMLPAATGGSELIGDALVNSLLGGLEEVGEIKKLSLWQIVVHCVLATRFQIAEAQLRLVEVRAEAFHCYAGYAAH